MEKKKSDVQLDEILNLSQETLQKLYNMTLKLIGLQELYPHLKIIPIENSINMANAFPKEKETFITDVMLEQSALLKRLQNVGVISYKIDVKLDKHTGDFNCDFQVNINYKEIRILSDQIKQKLEGKLPEEQKQSLTERKKYLITYKDGEFEILTKEGKIKTFSLKGENETILEAFSRVYKPMTKTEIRLKCAVSDDEKDSFNSSFNQVISRLRVYLSQFGVTISCDKPSNKYKIAYLE